MKICNKCKIEKEGVDFSKSQLNDKYGQCRDCTNIEGDNFKKCWNLSNLRPYSSKLNLLDGVNRVRHGENRK